MISIVLGMGFGDEGKGITTDFLCSQNPDSVVVRFSGGQQAGHTVMIDNKKHIHSNFGSGTLRGFPSYFSEHTCFYPSTIRKEMEKLAIHGVTPKLTLHPLAKLTTPFDVYLNRQDSNNLDHGTCGLGIGKTMKRNEGPYKIYAVDLLNPNILAYKLLELNNFYKKNKFDYNADIELEYEYFIKSIQQIEWDIQDYSYLDKFTSIIFEGSQGILLDMDHGVFPNVTYSNTTSKNVFDIVSKLNTIHEIETYYITRSYLTRHGEGWFNKEMDLKLINNEEEINKFNQYQKNFKISELDYNLLNYALEVDSIYSKSHKSNLVVTCMDQRPGFQFDVNLIKKSINKIIYSNSPDSKDFKF